MNASSQKLYDVCDATWPAANTRQFGNWTLRDGQGGGKRVSAATANGSISAEDIPQAETEMRTMGQTPLFMIREGDGALDTLLDQRGYAIIDPVLMYSIPVTALTDQPLPRVTIFCLWEPLAIMAEIWEKGGIGSQRLNVMARATEKTSIFARWKDKPAGVAFAAISDEVCMVHAVEILEHQRRQGVGKLIMRQAGFWAVKQGAAEVAVLCTTANTGANELYKSLGFSIKARYHYRQMPKDK